MIWRRGEAWEGTLTESRAEPQGRRVLKMYIHGYCIDRVSGRDSYVVNPLLRMEAYPISECVHFRYRNGKHPVSK